MYVFYLRMYMNLEIDHGGGERPQTYSRSSPTEYLVPNKT